MIVGEEEPKEQSPLIFVPALGARRYCASLVPGIRARVLEGEGLVLFEDGLGIEAGLPHLDHAELVLEVSKQVCGLGVAAEAGNGRYKNIWGLLHSKRL